MFSTKELKAKESLILDFVKTRQGLNDIWKLTDLSLNLGHSCSTWLQIILEPVRHAEKKCKGLVI